MIIHRIQELNHYERYFLMVLRELEADKKPVKLTYDQIGDLIGCTRGTVAATVKTVSEKNYVHVIQGKGRAASKYQLMLNGKLPK